MIEGGIRDAIKEGFIAAEEGEIADEAEGG
jgi:hypothetical protein